MGRALSDAAPQPVAGRPSVVLVAGPTASGKSGLALALAQRFGGTVINADAMQVYRELAILTARPGPRALAAVPHRLYATLSGADPCSAGRWRALAEREIAAAQAAGRLPIVVGGTGLYLKALERGLAALPTIPEPVRAAARRRHAALGGAAFHQALAERDPVMAARLHPRDSQRLIRAWEVLEATGRSLADWQAEQEAAATPGRFLRLTLLPERSALYRACDRRFEAMMAAGALDEVRRLAALGLDPALPVMKALGVRPLLSYLAGDLSLERALAEGQTETRRYAKRQLTWLRTQVAPGRRLGEAPKPDLSCKNDASWTIEEQYSAQLDGEIFSIIRSSMLTLPN